MRQFPQPENLQLLKYECNFLLGQIQIQTVNSSDGVN